MKLLSFLIQAFDEGGEEALRDILIKLEQHKEEFKIKRL
ncbi:MAG: hypothetical protein IRD7MM_05075 [Candidatus Midichloria mitochondrii]